MSATSTEAGAATPTPPAATASRRHADQTPRLLAVGGIFGALGAASCCVIPFALFLAGVSGAWIGNLTALEPYQPIFAAASLGFIGYGAWRLRRKRELACADGYCATQPSPPAEARLE
jgi:mercuric ion transport protein